MSDEPFITRKQAERRNYIGPAFLVAYQMHENGIHGMQKCLVVTGGEFGRDGGVEPGDKVRHLGIIRGPAGHQVMDCLGHQTWELRVRNGLENLLGR